MKRPLDQLAEIAQKAVHIGNDLIENTRPRIVTEKSDRDTYTDVDVTIEHEVRAYLTKTTPEIGFMGEEEGTDGQVIEDEYFWAFDPIDGTANFIHGVPLCAISLALIKQDQAIVAAITLPYLDLFYSATRGHGSKVNGQIISASKTVELSKP